MQLYTDIEAACMQFEWQRKYDNEKETVKLAAANAWKYEKQNKTKQKTLIETNKQITHTLHIHIVQCINKQINQSVVILRKKTLFIACYAHLSLRCCCYCCNKWNKSHCYGITTAKIGEKYSLFFKYIFDYKKYECTGIICCNARHDKINENTHSPCI